jgi:hypothetical protein
MSSTERQVRPSHGSMLVALLDRAQVIALSRWWPLYAVLAGVIPVLAGYSLGSAMHQPITAMMLAAPFFSCALRGLFARALGLVAVVMGLHSAVCIVLSCLDEPGAAAALSGSSAYWQQTLAWLRTGEDPEYQASAALLMQHLTLLGSVAVGACLTLGAGPFVEGVFQLDQMNSYVGRLVAQSHDPLSIALLAWHPWSILRGIACSILTFECVAWMAARLAPEAVSAGHGRGTRLAVAAGLATADVLTKASLAPLVREQLYAYLWPDFH